MTFAPYIHFTGNCEAAMRFYADVFGASDLMLNRYADMPADACPGGTPPTGEAGQRIMHASFTAPGGKLLMASDWPPGMPAAPQASVSVSSFHRSAGEAKAAFDRLAEGAAEIMMPFGATFFSEGFGMLRDRFGTAWMVMGPERT